MLNIAVRAEHEELRVRLQGDLDANAGPALGMILSEIDAHGAVAALHVNCAGLRTINSVGVLRWMDFRKNLPVGLPVRYANCPITFVDYANLMAAFVDASQVVSIEVPIHCACGFHGTPVLGVDTLLALGTDVPCPRCGGAATPEVALADYLVFLRLD